MHHAIVVTDLEVDHRDGDTLNYRRKNLRIATRAQNMANTRVRSDSLSQLKGAHYHPCGRWTSKIKLFGGIANLGMFDTAEEAHAAYCAVANKYRGEFSPH